MGIWDSIKGFGKKHYGDHYRTMTDSSSSKFDRSVAGGKLLLNSSVGLPLYYGIKGGLAGTKGILKSGVNKAKNYNQNNRYVWLIIVSAIIYWFAYAWRATLALRFSVHIIIFLCTFFLIMTPSERREKETLILIVFIFILEVLMPTYVYKLEFLKANKFIINYLINPQVTLCWFYFAVFKADDNSKFVKIVKILVFCLWVSIFFSIASTALTFDDVYAQMTPEQIAKAESIYIQAWDFWADVIVNFKQVVRQGKTYFIIKFNSATGTDYFTGQVDENQNRNLGVFLKDLRASDPEFIYGDDITVWALLEAKTLEDGINIDLGCYHGAKTNEGVIPESQKGEVYSDKGAMSIVYNDEKVDLDCRFGKYTQGLTDGSNKVSFVADFNFETMGYIKAYFMDADRLRSMVRQGIDPLKEYGIEDKDPVAKYTNGPVKIGMGTVEEQPIGIQDKYSVKPRIGVTLETNDGWVGKIKQVEELIIMVPDSMSLDTDFCSEFVEYKADSYKANCVANYKKYRSKQFTDCLFQAGLDREENVDSITGEIIKTSNDKISSVNTCMETYCDNELKNYKAYKLDINDKNKNLYANIGYDAKERYFKTFSCRLNLDQPNNIVLSDTPITTQYFRVKARYIYEIEEGTNINIKGVKSDPYKTDVPKPTKENNANVPFVYNYWGKYIKDQCKTKINGESFFLVDENCICFLTAIMNQESRGDPNVVSSAGAVGLMQVMPSTADQMKNRYKLAANYDLFKPEDNINMGYHYLHYLSKSELTKQSGSVKLEWVIAGYNGGLCGTSKTGGQTGALCVSDNDKCQGKKSYACEENEGYAETRNYVPKVLSDYNYCLNKQFVQYATIEPDQNVNDFIQTKGDVVLVSKQKKQLDNNLYLSFEKVENEYYFKLFLKNIQIDSLNIVENKNNNGYYNFNKYPFVLIKVGTETKDSNNVISLSIDAQTWKPTRVTLNRIELNKKVPDAQGVVRPDLRPIWVKDGVTYLYAYYDDDIIIYDQNKLKICEIPWGDDAVYRYCEDDKAVGLMVKNIKTNEGTIFSDSSAFVSAQFIYNPTLEHSCCKKINTCTDFQKQTCKVTTLITPPSSTTPSIPSSSSSSSTTTTTST